MEEKKWNPYVAGGLTGIVATLSVLISGKYFGASTTFVRTAGLIEKSFAPEKIAKMEYFIKKVPKLDWQFMFVVGIFLGALIASSIFGNFKIQAIPDMWKSRFGKSIPKRAGAALLGGFIAIFGARLAGGCPSGHGISGLMQLSISGYVALICFFVGGVIMVNLLYRGGEKKWIK